MRASVNRSFIVVLIVLLGFFVLGKTNTAISLHNEQTPILLSDFTSVETCPSTAFFYASLGVKTEEEDVISVDRQLLECLSLCDATFIGAFAQTNLTKEAQRQASLANFSNVLDCDLTIEKALLYRDHLF